MRDEVSLHMRFGLRAAEAVDADLYLSRAERTIHRLIPSAGTGPGGRCFRDRE